MNTQCYRLVFNRRLGMPVPVSETSRANVGKRNRRLSRARLLSALAAALAIPALAAGPAPTALPTGAVVRYGNIGIAQSGTTLNINQSTQNGIIHWDSFNIGSQATVNFNQPNSASATLNRIVGNEASVIQGAMNATGAVYVINRNGILFDKGAQINLHTLVGSTLDIKDDDLFRNGFLTANPQDPAFSDTYTAFTGSSVPAGMVQVAEGASITAASGGRVILLAPNVENRGIIRTDSGQIILAAGHKAYFHLTNSSDSNSLLRGLLVEVESGGEAVNLGELVAQQGDVSMIGKLVKQNGVASATTTVNLNGTIHLLAQDINRDKPLKYLASDSSRLAANETGDVVIGENSRSVVLPALDPAKLKAAIDGGKLTQVQVDAYLRGEAKVADFYPYMPDTTLQDAQTYNPSNIDVQGHNIWVQKNAALLAPGGVINLYARQDPTSIFLINPSDPGSFAVNGLCADCRLQIDDGAQIDVSGLRDVAVAMERNVVEVELRGSVLADSPLLRDPANPLYAKKIKVDIRNSSTVDVNGQKLTRQGTSLVDASGYIAQIGRKVDEKSAAGGKVNLYSEGELVIQNGAGIDLSGGSIKYQDGQIATTQLLYQGKPVDIATASPDLAYEGVGPDKVVNEHGYTEGKNAGTLNVVAPFVALQGTIKGGTVIGERQRGQTGDALPRGAAFNLGIDNPSGPDAGKDYRTLNAIRFTSAAQSAAPDYGTPLAQDLKDALALDAAKLKQGGISRLAVYTNNGITIESGQTLDMGPGGSVSLTGGSLDIEGDILAPGGNVNLTGTRTVYTQALVDKLGLAPANLDQHVSIGAGGQIVTAGLWTNDFLTHDAVAPVVLDGGAITISAQGLLQLEAGSLLDASAGGWLKTDGKSMAGGKGGDISLLDNRPSAAGGNLLLAGELRSYGLLDSSGKVGKGGRLTLKTLDVKIGGQAAASSAVEFWLPESFFAQGGFSAYEVRSIGDLKLAANARVEPRSLTRILGSSMLQNASGKDIAAFSTPSMLSWGVAKAERLPASLSLSALTDTNNVGGHLTIAAGAQILADPRAAVSLAADRSLDVEGRLSAPGGSLQLSLNPQADKGYQSDAAIWLGQSAELSAAGIARIYQATNGLRQGEVLDGGSISLLANSGYLVAQPGAILDVSGAAGQIDLPRSVGSQISYASNTVASAGGAIKLAAAEGLFLGADMHAAGGSAEAPRGTLTVQLDRPDLSSTQLQATPQYLQGPRSLEIYASQTPVPGYLTQAGTALADADNGRGMLAASQLAGFDHVSLKSRDQIVFKDDVDLSLRGRLVLDTPSLVLDKQNAVVNLNALYLGLGNADPFYQTATHVPGPVAGAGQFNANAGLIDVMGHFALSGTSQVSLVSEGDLRLIGVVSQGDTTLTPAGTFATAGDLTLKVAQAYPTTLSDYTLVSTQPGGRISILGNGSPTPVPLSAGGSLTVKADVIEQAGALRAPLGSIALDAKDQLTLADGSLTSVSAEGQFIPFGRVENGLSWVYDLNVGASANKRTVFSGADGVVNLAEKEIRLNGAAIDQQKGARLDLSGGGDLYGYEFTPGPGGSRDYLSDPGVFAILPGNAGAFAPFDFQYSQYAYSSADASTRVLGAGAAQTVLPGQSVYLSSILGLLAGYYTLLPGHYALLPGAYAVRAVANTQDMLPAQNIQRADGAYLVAGYRSGLGSSDTGTARWSGFELASRQVVSSRENYAFRYSADELKAQKLTSRSEIHDYLASQLIPQVASNYDLSLPKFGPDAGDLGIKAQTTLKLDGSINFAKPDGARGGELDISAPKIAVTDGSKPDDYVVLDVKQLNAYKVDSLLLGGVRENLGDQGSVYLDQGADEVLVDTGTGTALQAPEVMLIARQTVTVTDNSVIRGAGNAVADKRSLVFGREASYDSDGNLIDPGVSGDGALLRVSSNGLRDVVRHDVSLSQGDLVVETGAYIYGEKSATLDVTHNSDNQGSVALGENGALHVGAARISIGNVASVAEGTIISNASLAELGTPDEIALKSYGNFDIYGDAILGGAGTQRLTLEGAGIAGVSTGNLAISAKTVSFANPDGRDVSPTPTGSGTMAVQADKVEFGQGQMKTVGFDQVNLTARGEIAGMQGKGGLDTSGDLTLTARRLTGYKGSDMSFSAGGTLVTANYVPAAGESLPALADTPLGAKLTLSGASIKHGGNIDLPAGWLSMTAASGDLDLLAGSTIFSGGVARTFKGVSDSVDVYVPGGLTSLQATLGSVNVAQGAVVDVSGRGGADAGILEIGAPNGVFNLQGQLKGGAQATTAVPDPRQGEFSLDADALADFSALLQHMDGFGERFSLRQRQGDLRIVASDTVKAKRVAISVDQGSLDIQGKIDSASTNGGWVMAAAGREVYLRTGAVIDAQASGANQRGGEVYLISGMDRDYVSLDDSNGALVLENGSAIKVGGTLPGVVNFAGNTAGAPDIVLSQVSGGRVHLQAPRLANGQDVRITQALGIYDDNGGQGAIGTSISGAALIEALGNKVFDYSMLGTSQMNAIKADSQNYMATASSALARLGPGLGAAFHVRPAVEVRSSGDLTFNAANYNLYSVYRLAGEPGTLTFRAEGNLLVNENLSDGFDKVDASGKLQGGDSWTYRLVAGADLSAADPLAVVQGAGNLVLKGGKLIRTGTGALQIAVGGDVEIGLNADGSYNRASVIYTAGRADANPAAYKTSTDSQFKKVAFGVDGGALSIAAGGSIRAPEFGQLTDNWLQRRGALNSAGGITTSPAWGVAYEYFNQGVGALGGGNVRIAAGQDIENLAVSLPTTERDYAAQDAGSKLFETGGGNAELLARGDILGSFLYVQKGNGRVISGGEIGAMPGQGQSQSEIQADAADNRNLVLAMGEGQMQVAARNGLGLETVFNPTVAATSPLNRTSDKSSKSSDFFTYGQDSSVQLVAAQGDLLLSNDPSRVVNTLLVEDTSGGSVSPVGDSAFFVYPGSLSAAAVNGSLSTGGRFALYPAGSGELHLLAHNDVVFGDGLAMSDVDPVRLPAVNSPGNFDAADNLLFAIASGTAYHAPDLTHAHDTDPVRVYAEDGSISAVRHEQGASTLYFPKPVEFLAGEDIRDVSLTAQHLAQGQTSYIRAGRDIRYAPNRTDSGSLARNGSGIQLGGPGYLELDAGRNLDLGNTEGVITNGNKDNPALPAEGAHITLLAGMGADAQGRPRQPDYAGFAASYLKPGSAALTDFYASLEDYEIRRMALLQPENAGLSYAQVQKKLEQPGYRATIKALAGQELILAQAAFDGLPPEVQSREVYYHELAMAGQEANQGKGYERAYKAIEAFFPAKDQAGNTIAYSGNLSGFFSQVRTNQGGDVQFLAPGGSVTVGLVSKPSDLTTKDSELGVFTVDGGSIQSYSRDSFNVNTSRVFTLGQERIPLRTTDYERMLRDDILLFSQFGNIDAGKGAKTTTAAPPPTYEYDNKGNLKVNLANSISGSGIGVLLAREVIVPGDVSLIAPAGEVNAGDAGIRVSGNLNIAAAHVVGADNIQVSGLTVGVPVALDTSGLSVSGIGSLGDTQATNEATHSLASSSEESQKSAQELKQSLAGFKLSFITAEVIGFGEAGTDSGDNRECKKRNDCKDPQ